MHCRGGSDRSISKSLFNFCLQAIYTDPGIKREIRAAAAKAVLPHQYPKLSIQGYANVTALAQRLDGVRAKVIELPKPIDAV